MKCFRWQSLLVPFTIQLVRIGSISYIGYRRIYVFGILIAEIQETKPWE